MSNVTLGGIPNVVIAGFVFAAGQRRRSGEDQLFGDVLSNAVHSVDQLNDIAASQVSNLLQGGGGDMNR